MIWALYESHPVLTLLATVAIDLVAMRLLVCLWPKPYIEVRVLIARMFKNK